MKTYDFDRIVDRQGTNAVKYDALTDVFGNKELLPLWVADMDFATPDFILDALRWRLDHPVLGYTQLPDDYWPQIAAWIEARHGWRPDPAWMRFIPGIVKGIGMAVLALTRPGDKVVIQPPVYHPFRLVPEQMGRRVVCNPLRRTGDRYEMDFEQFEALLDDDCRLLLLSNPHNPAGIVWPEETLRRLAAICDRRGVVVVSDEIHCDMALYGHRHRPFASVSDAAAHCSVTFGAPTKTFNIAGVVSSYAIVPDEALRRHFFGWLEAGEFHEAPPALGRRYPGGFHARRRRMAAADAAVRRGERRLHRRLSAAIRSPHPGDPPRSVVPRLARLPGTGAGPRCARRPLRRTRRTGAQRRRDVRPRRRRTHAAERRAAAHPARRSARTTAGGGRRTLRPVPADVPTCTAADAASRRRDPPSHYRTPPPRFSAGWVWKVGVFILLLCRKTYRIRYGRTVP